MATNETKARALRIIDGRERIPAGEAFDAVGLHPSRATPDATHVRPNIPISEDRTVSAADVLASLDTTVRRHRARNARSHIGLTVEDTADPDVWTVLIEETGTWIGDIAVTAVHPEPLARPPRLLRVWVALDTDPGNDQGVGAPSARAAILHLVRASTHTRNAIEPSWGSHVRALTGEQLAALQADRSGNLTQWEREESERDARPNPEYRLWEHLVRTRGHEEAEERMTDPQARQAVDTRIRRPEPMTLSLRSHPSAVQLDIRGVAHLIGTSESTVRSYAARDQMPPADGTNQAGRPWWRRETILAWQESRRGQGWRGRA